MYKPDLVYIMQTTLTVTHLRLLAKSHCVQEAACRDAEK